MNTLSDHKYHYLYKITLKDSDLFYYGIHSTDNIDDGYMGSGSELRRLYKRYGRDRFEKEYIKFFSSRKEASDYEHMIINEEMLNNKNCLNMVPGGDMYDDYATTKGLVTVRDKDGNTMDVKVDDPRYLSRELIPVNSGYAVVKDSAGKCFRINTDDPSYISGKYIPVSKGNKAFSGKTIVYKDSDYKVISKEELDSYIEDGWEIRSKCRGRVSPTKGMVHLTKGDLNIMVPKEEMKSYTEKGWENKRDVKPLQGTICVNKDGKDVYIQKQELSYYLEHGYTKGGVTRNKGKLTCSLDGGKTYIQLDKDDPLVKSGEAKMAFEFREPACKGMKYIHKGTEVKRIKPEKLEEYLSQGWSIGMKDK